MKAEWARLAFIENSTASPNQVESVGPARISALDSIVEAINQRWKFDAQLAHARACNESALYLIDWAAEEHLIAHIGLHLPHVRGMRLKNVNDVESDLVAVPLGELVQGGNLPPKGRSRIAAKNQDDWFVGPKGR